MSEDSEDCPLGVICSVDGTDRNKSCNEIREQAKKEGFGDIHAGLYCPQGRTGYENCPAGSYCLTPSVLQPCPQGYFCPYKTSEYKIKCPLCEEGAENMAISFLGLILTFLICMVLCIYVLWKLVQKFRNEAEEKHNDLTKRELSHEEKEAIKVKEQERLGRMRPILSIVEERIKGKCNENSRVKMHELENIFEDNDDDELKFNAELLYRVLDNNLDGNLSFTEINEVLDLNPGQIQSFVTSMNEAAGYFEEREYVDRDTFVEHFLDTLEYSTNFGVSPEEAATLFDELLIESGSNQNVGLSQSFFHRSRKLEIFLDHKQIYLLLDGFRNKREEAGQNSKAKKMPITREEFIEWYPTTLDGAMTDGCKTTRRLSVKMSLGIDLTFEDISLEIPLAGGRSFNVVDHVSGRLEAKTMTALMGGSGAGKTSLLNALCGRAYYGKVTGCIKINGIEASMDDNKSLMGFVPQDDIVYAELTVRENFIMSGRFRLPPSTSYSDIEALAEATMADLGLSRVADSIVGDVSTRGVSGGEKKRVNIGLELMAKPRILFLDEPTSGLDSSSADLVMKSLKDLVDEKDVTICTIIHQPRKSIFDLIDSLVLLGVGGKMVYHGPCDEAKDFFVRKGYVLPNGVSVADWLIDISSGSLDRKEDVKKAHRGSHRKLEVAKTNREFLYSHWISHYEELDDKERLKYLPPHPTEIPEAKVMPSFFHQFSIQLGRCFLVAYRNSFTKVLDTGMIMFAAFVVSIGDTVELATDNDPNVSFDTFYSIDLTRLGEKLPEFFKYSLNSYRSLSEYAMKMGVVLSVLIGLTATKILTSKRIEFFREAGSGYNINAYFLAVNIMSTIEQGLQVVIAACVGLWLKNTTTSIENYFLNYLMLSWHCVSWALLLPLIIPRQNVVLVTGLFMSLFGLLFSGVLSPVEYKDLYASAETEIFSAFVSSPRFFIETMIVSEYQCLPVQSGFTVNAIDAPKFEMELNSFSLLGLGKNDNQISKLSCEGWWWFVLPSFMVGLTIRFVALGTLHITSRGKQAKQSLTKEIMSKNIPFILSGIIMLAIIAVLFAVTCWVIVN